MVKKTQLQEMMINILVIKGLSKYIKNIPSNIWQNLNKTLVRSQNGAEHVRGISLQSIQNETKAE